MAALKNIIISGYSQVSGKQTTYLLAIIFKVPSIHLDVGDMKIMVRPFKLITLMNIAIAYSLSIWQNSPRKIKNIFDILQIHSQTLKAVSKLTTWGFKLQPA